MTLTKDQEKLLEEYTEETKRLNGEINVHLEVIKNKRRRINNINRKAMGILYAARVAIKDTTKSSRS